MANKGYGNNPYGIAPYGDPVSARKPKVIVQPKEKPRGLQFRYTNKRLLLYIDRIIKG